MGRRRQSGIFETLFKSAFGVGTTVHYKTDWLGRKKKVVKHHDSGKTKTYTHGAGFFGNKTRTKTVKHGRVIEEGTVRENLFGSGATEHARNRDGTEVKRNYSPGIFRDHVSTRENGICFKCDGAGQKQITCRTCSGTGMFTFPERECFGPVVEPAAMGKINVEDVPVAVYMRPESKPPAIAVAALGSVW